VSSLIETQAICKAYGNVYAADNISMVIPQGSIYGLLGPNGAGKTTLIRMMTTITEPDSGTITYKGEALSENHAAKMGYMPEERGLYKRMNVIDQLLFFAEIKGVPKAIAIENAKKWLARMDMQTWERKKVEELSKGMAQKVQFLCTVIHNPEFIILDEPFSGFDPVNADLIKDIILELNQQGATILFSTHRMDNVEELCDYLCIINHGKMQLDGEAGTLRRKMFQQKYEAGYLEKKNFTEDKYKPINEIKSIDGRFMYQFQLNATELPETLLQQCVNKTGLVYFSENLPSIHQIFVETVKNQLA
jgi:ABC-2 type transport system ATP-binding protein